MEKLQKVENSTKQVDDMVKFILKDYLTELDGYINIVKSCFLSDKEVSDEDLKEPDITQYTNSNSIFEEINDYIDS